MLLLMCNVRCEEYEKHSDYSIGEHASSAVDLTKGFTCSWPPARGRDPKTLQGLRKRISSLFLTFCTTPDFNPEAARFQLRPAGTGSGASSSKSKGVMNATAGRLAAAAGVEDEKTFVYEAAEPAAARATSQLRDPCQIRAC